MSVLKFILLLDELMSDLERIRKFELWFYYRFRGVTFWLVPCINVGYEGFSFIWKELMFDSLLVCKLLLLNAFELVDSFWKEKSLFSSLYDLKAYSCKIDSICEILGFWNDFSFI